MQRVLEQVTALRGGMAVQISLQKPGVAPVFLFFLIDLILSFCGVRRDDRLKKIPQSGDFKQCVFIILPVSVRTIVQNQPAAS